MKQLESGGCCLARRGVVASFASKAERIMARFRPIAPKPTTAQSSANCPLALEAPASSASAAESFAAGLGTGSVKSRRVRKRRADSDARSSKRSNCGRLDLPRCCASDTVDASVCASTIPGNTRIQIGDGDRGGFGLVAPDFARGRLRRGDTYVDAERNADSELSQASDGAPGGRKMVLGKRFQSCSWRKAEGVVVQKVISDLMDSSGSFKRDDAAFVGRAAASVSSHAVFPERRYGGKTGDKRDCVANMETEGILSISTREDENGVAPSTEARDTAELITLPLLPDTPSHADFFPFSTFSVVATDSDMGSGVSDKLASGDRPSMFSLFGDELWMPPGNGLGSWTNHHNPAFLDAENVEKIHGQSPDPVLLVDDSRQVIWFNKAYAKAVKAMVERGSCKAADIGPYIDPLGIPTALGTFSLQSSPKPSTSIATLWGFLKKLVVQDFNGVKEEIDLVPLRGLFKHLAESKLAPVDMLSLSAREQKTSLVDREEAKKHGVIMPQPKRLVGSTVSLESVTEVHSHTDPVCDSLEVIEAQLEESSMPAFISSRSNRVSWVNTAYKQMIGQPECPWLASTVTTSSKVVGPSPTVLQSPRPNGEVSLICTSGKIPGSAAAFSGRVNIQWTNMGERSSMIVPCDVTRLDGWMLVWKFDVTASLRLTCGW